MRGYGRQGSGEPRGEWTFGILPHGLPAPSLPVTGLTAASKWPRGLESELLNALNARFDG